MARTDATWYGRLDRRVIVDAALRVAARPGVTEVRFRDLGEELGADPTAVYRHFRDKSALMAALVDRLMDDVTRSLPSGAGWRAVLEAMATSSFELFTAHPAIGARLVDPRPVGPGEFGLIEVSLRAFESAGLRGERLVTHYGAFSGMLLAYIAAACREPVTSGDPDATWLPAGLEQLAADFPTMSRYAERLLSLDYRTTYAAGVRVLLDSVAHAAGDATGSSS